MTRRRALRVAGRAIFASNLLHGGDFEDIAAHRVTRPFVRGTHGVRIEFSISRHALEKIARSRQIEMAIESLLLSEDASDAEEE